MANEIEWSVNALAQLSKIDKRYIQAIRNKVAQLKDFPQVRLDLKKLQDTEYRLRVGDYRVFFEVVNGTPTIIKIQQIKRRSNRTAAAIMPTPSARAAMAASAQHAAPLCAAHRATTSRLYHHNKPA